VNPVTHVAVLRSLRPVAERTRHFEFEVQNGRQFDFRPGQFISLDLDLRGTPTRGLYSIASAPREDNRFDLCLNILSEAGAAASLFDLKPGDAIRFTGPFGFFTLREPPDPVSAFIATGTGIAPIRAMLQHLYRRRHGGEVWLIFGTRHQADILYGAEFEKLAQENPGFHFIPTLSRPESGWTGLHGYVQQHIPRYLSAKRGFHAYVCGLRRMVEDVTQELKRMGYGPQAISSEEFD
jgi:ferredoxin-NADP reductase